MLCVTVFLCCVQTSTPLRSMRTPCKHFFPDHLFSAALQVLVHVVRVSPAKSGKFVPQTVDVALTMSVLITAKCQDSQFGNHYTAKVLHTQLQCNYDGLRVVHHGCLSVVPHVAYICFAAHCTVWWMSALADASMVGCAIRCPRYLKSGGEVVMVWPAHCIWCF